MSDSFARLSDALGKMLGQENISVQEDSCTIAFDEHVVTAFVAAATDEVILFGDICPFSEDMPREKLLRMLEAQALFAETAGATFSLSRSLKTVFLQVSRPFAVLDENSLRIMLENFTDMLAYWKEELGGNEDGVASGSEEMPEQADLQLMMMNALRA